jgi:intein/homing endonuclease
LSEWTVCEPKNVGRANATTANEQAIGEAQAKWDKKVKLGYTTDVTKIDSSTSFVEPMLAKNYDDYRDKMDWEEGVFVQNKYNGCLASDCIIQTNLGPLTIGDIVNKQIDCEVLSYNTKTKKQEYKKVLHFMKNHGTNDVVWYEVETSSGDKIKLTGCHKVYLPRLQCWRRVDELTPNDVIMLKNIQ